MQLKNLPSKRNLHESYIITQFYVRDSNRAQSKSIYHWIIIQNSLQTVTAMVNFDLKQKSSKILTIAFSNANVRTRTKRLTADKTSDSIEIHAVLEYLNQNLNQKQEIEHD